MSPSPDQALDAIAIIGMSGRWPAARDVEEFWSNLCGGVESIRPFTHAEVAAAGFDPAVMQLPGFVNAGAPIDDAEMFDAAFFGITAREAQALDPQRRVFLECAWHALEDAGQVPENVAGPIGVFGGSSLSAYLGRVQANRDLVAAVGGYQVVIGNDKDHLTTYTAYKLNLTGPAVTVQTACSTSLVAVSMACQSLLNLETDLALAGGVSVRLPQHVGYFYEEGGILSPDGHCRTFDAEAQGTVAGSGVGVVVLKRLSDAQRDGDRVRAVILGAAINNDGALKVGYTAPSVEGQAAVIATTLVLAGVAPESIGYVEAHGTATPLGDPIEIAALCQAFGRTQRRNFCAIGAVKSNIGHLDAAAGVTGIIKAALCVERGSIPPSLHFASPNPAIDFANSPFRVQDRLSDWDGRGAPRRAAVSSVGIGGTNAHAILEQAPAHEPSGPSREHQLLVFSARTPTALARLAESVASDLREGLERPLGDVAFTLATGRRAQAHRRAVVCRDVDGAIAALEDPRAANAGPVSARQGLAFVFPGQGSQHAGMGSELYRTEPLFREEIDRCALLLRPPLGYDLRDALFGSDATDERLRETALTQPALFSVEYALARLLMSWGIVPVAMLGHSVGEYVAACLAGVFTLEDALALVAARGRLMQCTGAGAMLATSLTEAEAQSLAAPDVDIAALNGPSQTVLSGAEAALARVEKMLQAQGVACVRLNTSHAFHSAMMDPILGEFRVLLQGIEMRAPSLPFISNCTGTWQTAKATEPQYWVDQLRHAVRFGDGYRELAGVAGTVVEVGPGSVLRRLVQANAGADRIDAPIASGVDPASVLAAVGALWCRGIAVDWPAYFARERRRRVSMPLYPFEWQRYDAAAPAEATTPRIAKSADVASWFYLPSWRQTRPVHGSTAGQAYLVFIDAEGFGNAVAQQLRDTGATVATITPSDAFERLPGAAFSVRPEEAGDYTTVLDALAAENTAPQCIVHCWNVARSSAPGTGFFPLLALAQALGLRPQEFRVAVASTSVHPVTGAETIEPEKATLLGPCRVVPHEHPQLRWQNVDVEWPSDDAAGQVIAECAAHSFESVVAYRGGRRWVEVVEATPIDANEANADVLRAEGVYLITGGLGGIGFAIAKHLASAYRAKLVLVGRTPLAAESPKRAAIAAMEEDGAQVLLCAADVADHQQMRGVIAQARARFGALNGVVHAAGVAGGGMIQVKERAVAQSVLAPKMLGAQVLEDLLHDTKLDFVVLFSSLASMLGGFGQVDYCAANAFLDACAYRDAARRDRLTLAIDWDTWAEVGMAVETPLPPEFEPYRQAALENAIQPAEGVDAFCRALGAGVPRLCVSTVYLPWRIGQAISAGPAAAVSAPAPMAAEQYARPQLSTEFVAASTETEQLVETMWRDLFGIERVGVTDDFFELGGHSLLATQLVARLRATLDVELSVRDVFDAPTIARLAQLLDKGAADADDLARVIGIVEQMDEAQVRTQLGDGPP